MIRAIIAFLTMNAATFSWASDLPPPPPNLPEPNMAEARLGQLLFYDPILSGNREVACATCHHPRFGTSDGLSLGLGDGAKGIGTERRIVQDNPPEQRIPRNSPALFNLGYPEFTRMFHDGRLEADPWRPGGIRTPLGEDMEQGFDSVLAAQTMFPVLSGDEMAGHYSENDVAQAVRMGRLTGSGGAWDIISKRVEETPEYRTAFDQVIGPGARVRFTDISNALAAFIAFEWRADDSPFDRHLRGEGALEGAALRGMELFYGEAECEVCHSGPFQTDHDFHAIAMPQIGPGKAARFEAHAQDTGRFRVTGDPNDSYRFRTPSLRNVTKTAPYGHSGAYETLEDALRHHLDPVKNLESYSIAKSKLPGLPGVDDERVLSDTTEMAAIAEANELAPRQLTDAQVADLLAFLSALEDKVSLSGRLGLPDRVPSGLPVDQ